MKKSGPEPSKGEAAWLAAKAEMAKRNDAARAQGAERHAAYEARRAEYRLAAEREEMSNLPEQPQP